MKRAFRTTAFLYVALMAGLATLLAGTAVAVAMVRPHATPSTAHGEGLLVKSVVDPNFCIDVKPGPAVGRPLTLSACGFNVTQRWTFTKNSDGTNLFVDSQGMCVDTAGRKPGDGVAVTVRNCSFVTTQRFRFSSVGRFQLNGTKTCLSIPRANAAAPLFLEPCNSANMRQQFKFAF